MALSKQFVLRLTPYTYEALAEKAKTSNLSVNSLLNNLIYSYLNGEIELEVNPELAKLNERITVIEEQISKIKPFPLYLMEQ